MVQQRIQIATTLLHLSLFFDLKIPVMKKFFVFSVFIITSALLSQACKKCQDPYDPCCKNFGACKGMANADFQIDASKDIYKYDSAFAQYFKPVGDSVYPNTIVTFRPYMKNVDRGAERTRKRIWILDNPFQTVEEDENFVINLGANISSASVTCILHKDPKTNCQFDDGQDTIKKTIYVASGFPPYQEGALAGRYTIREINSNQPPRETKINFNNVGRSYSVDSVYSYWTSFTDSELYASLGFKESNYRVFTGMHNIGVNYGNPDYRYILFGFIAHTSDSLTLYLKHYTAEGFPSGIGNERVFSFKRVN
jgi:hypothetical protein